MYKTREIAEMLLEAEGYERRSDYFVRPPDLWRGGARDSRDYCEVVRIGSEFTIAHFGE